MHSADAWAVFLDGLFEAGWCTRENAIKVYAVWFEAWPRKPEPHVDWDHEEWFVWIGQCIRDREEPIRAIVAVILFGEWSTERWPLVDAHEARARVRYVEAVRETIASYEKLGLIEPRITVVDTRNSGHGE